MSPDRIYRELALRVYEMASREAERHMLVSRGGASLVY